jgi:hypothetical protein
MRAYHNLSNVPSTASHRFSTYFAVIFCTPNVSMKNPTGRDSRQKSAKFHFCSDILQMPVHSSFASVAQDGKNLSTER